MKFVIILALFTVASAGVVKRQVGFYSGGATTTTIHHQHANPIMPMVVPQPIVYREFVHEASSTPEPTVAPVVQSKSEEIQQHEDNVQVKAEEPVQQKDSGLDGAHMGHDSSSSVSSSGSSFGSSSGSSFGSSPVTPSVSVTPSSIITPGFNVDNIFNTDLNSANYNTRAQNFGELDPHLNLNGQSYPSSSLPLSQGILPLNQGAVLPFSQGILPLAQGLFPNFQNTYSSILPVSYLNPVSYRSIPVFTTHSVLPPKPAVRQFPILTTTTLAPEIHQTRDSFPVKGHDTRSGVKGKN